MYDISYFKASNFEEVLAFMQAHPFITLCGVNAQGEPVATHIPVLIEVRAEKIFLRAHIMRKQTHTEAFLQNPNVLAIFNGPNSYVSASWYALKNVASTWNYQAVHAKGTLHFLEENALFNLLTDLTHHFENNPHSPALVKHMDESYITNHMKAIIAFEVELTAIEHVFKLSQNHEPANRAQIMQHLSEGTINEQMVAAVMKQREL